MEINNNKKEKEQNQKEEDEDHELVKLLFDLSSSDRLKMLLEIGQEKEGKLRLTDLAEKINATIQEATRHVNRLVEAKLIERNPHGLYTLTTFGRIVLILLPSFSFISKHRTRDYLLSHDISILPQEFIERIGELSIYHYAENVSSVLRLTEQVVSSAGDYVWLMADQALITGTTLAKAVANHDPLVRIIIPKGSFNLQEYHDSKKTLGDRLVLRLLPDKDVKVAIALNEKIAGIVFPDLRGKIDFDSGFSSGSSDDDSGNSNFHKWCSDLFVLYWNRSNNVSAAYLSSSF
jgi:predicted transcriptional regulator